MPSPARTSIVADANANASGTAFASFRPNRPPAAPPGTSRRVVALDEDRVLRFCRESGLDRDLAAWGLLARLVLDADRRTGALVGFTLTGYARRLGMGPSGRRTLAAAIRRLGAAGAVEHEPAGPGGRGGVLRVAVYDRLVGREAGRPPQGGLPACRGGGAS